MNWLNSIEDWIDIVETNLYGIEDIFRNQKEIFAIALEPLHDLIKKFLGLVVRNLRSLLSTGDIHFYLGVNAKS